MNIKIFIFILLIIKPDNSELIDYYTARYYPDGTNLFENIINKNFSKLQELENYNCLFENIVNNVLSKYNYKKNTL